MKQKLILTICAGLAFFIMTACPAPETNTRSNMNTNSNAVVMNNNAMMNSNMMNSNSMNSNMNTNMMNSNTTGSSANPTVGGAPMLATKNIVENASNSKDHTTLVAAVKAAGLVDTLEGTGPFTVFAPTNEAFDKLPKGTVDTLVKPESKAALTKILTYHVVPGKHDESSIAIAIEEGKGKTTMKTVQGEELTFSMDGKDMVVTDAKGGKAKITIPNVMQSNGVIHVVDTVLMPK